MWGPCMSFPSVSSENERKAFSPSSTRGQCHFPLVNPTPAKVQHLGQRQPSPAYSASSPTTDNPLHLWTRSTAGDQSKGSKKRCRTYSLHFPHLTCWHRFPSLKTSKTTRTTAMLPLILLWPPTQTGSHYLPLQQHSAHSKYAILWLPPYYFLSHFTSLISSFVCTFSSPIILKSAWAIFPLPASPQAT